ncbi:uncharacterized protein LOC114916794 [Cajanus cajan]|uniref:uncharacterized protein LOC114916794 n=1 Tax=Cajanus cajan TaxID=3821 RepID=UPI0010FAF889|nr:uncharacterized protein LOC114916794 [Cajanus cajan]
MKTLHIVHVLLLSLFIALLFASTPTEARRLPTLSLGFAQQTPWHEHEATLEVTLRPPRHPRRLPPPPPSPGYSPEPGPGHNLGSLPIPAANSESLLLNKFPLNASAASA